MKTYVVTPANDHLLPAAPLNSFHERWIIPRTDRPRGDRLPEHPQTFREATTNRPIRSFDATSV
jgi:hypothetical protein